MNNIILILSNKMESDGIRLQIEAEEKREISNKEWETIVLEWYEDIKNTMTDCSMSFEEAYNDIMY